MQNPIVLIAMLVLLPSPSFKPQDFRVLVLDALSGKPQSKMQVDFYCRGSGHNSPPEEVDTDEEGIVIVPYGCKGVEPKIVIDVTGLPKEQCGSSAVAATFEEISATGIISPPDAAGEMHCTTKISRKLKPVPGQVVIFVKKPSWWQSHF